MSLGKDILFPANGKNSANTRRSSAVSRKKSAVRKMSNARTEILPLTTAILTPTLVRMADLLHFCFKFRPFG